MCRYTGTIILPSGAAGAAEFDRRDRQARTHCHRQRDRRSCESLYADVVKELRGMAVGSLHLSHWHLWIQCVQAPRDELLRLDQGVRCRQCCKDMSPRTCEEANITDTSTLRSIIFQDAIHVCTTFIIYYSTLQNTSSLTSSAKANKSPICKDGLELSRKSS